MDNSLSDKIIHLMPWMEISGRLRGISRDDYFTYVRIGNVVLSFANGSPEAKFLMQRLDKWVGQKVAILRTDIPKKSLMVRPSP